MCLWMRLVLAALLLCWEFFVGEGTLSHRGTLGSWQSTVPGTAVRPAVTMVPPPPGLTVSGLEDGLRPYGGGRTADVPRSVPARSPPTVLCVTNEKRLVSVWVRKPAWQRKAGWGN